MKWILGVYSMGYNRIYDKRGHVWGGRYFSRAIDSFSEYLFVYRYIDQNPVKAGLVAHAADWEWGGLGHHLRQRRDIVTAPFWWQDLIAELSTKRNLLQGVSPPISLDDTPCKVYPFS